MTEFANVTERELFPCGKIIRDSKEHFHYDLLCSNKHGSEEAQQLRCTQKTARATRVYLPLLPCLWAVPAEDTAVAFCCSTGGVRLICHHGNFWSPSQNEHKLIKY